MFNVGNVAGTGLGLDALLDVPARWGGVISSGIAIGVFLSRRAGIAMNRVVVILGFLMIAMDRIHRVFHGRRSPYIALEDDPAGRVDVCSRS